MDCNDIVLSLLAAAAMASLAGLGLIKTDKKEEKFKVTLATADMDVMALTAIFIFMMVACHPEWVS
jgi:hypothetical protein